MDNSGGSNIDFDKYKLIKSVEDDAFRERLIKELREYPNVLLFCGDELSASHSIFCRSEKELAMAVISILKKEPQLRNFMVECLNHV